MQVDKLLLTSRNPLYRGGTLVQRATMLDLLVTSTVTAKKIGGLYPLWMS